MRRLIGLIALLVVILGAAWLVQNGYDRAQTAGDTAAVEPPAAGEESNMSAASGDATPAPEAEMPSSTAESGAPEEPAAPETEMATAESPMSSDQAAGTRPEVGTVPSFDVVRVEPSGDTVIAGLAAPAATVELLDGPEALATAEANERGEWAMALDKPLPAGTHDLAIRTTSADKTVVTLSDQRVAVEISEGGAEEPLVVLNAPDAPSQVMQIPAEPEVATAPGTGSGTEMAEARQEGAMPEAEAMTSAGMPTGEDEPSAAAPETEMAAVSPEPAAPTPTEAPAMATSESEAVGQASRELAAVPESGGSAAPVEAEAPPVAMKEPPTPEPKVSVAAIEAETNGALYIAGTAMTTEPVRVYLDKELVGEATPSETGTWLVETKRELPPGEYMVRADQVEGGSGSVIARAEVPFEREIEVAILKPTGEPASPGSAEVSGSIADPITVIIKRGDNLWRISRELYGNGLRYSTIYQANRDQIRNPDLIYPGQVFILPSGDTSWQN